MALLPIHDIRDAGEMLGLVDRWLSTAIGVSHRVTGREQVLVERRIGRMRRLRRRLAESRRFTEGDGDLAGEVLAWAGAKLATPPPSSGKE